MALKVSRPTAQEWDEALPGSSQNGPFSSTLLQMFTEAVKFGICEDFGTFIWMLQHTAEAEYQLRGEDEIRVRELNAIESKHCVRFTDDTVEWLCRYPLFPVFCGVPDVPEDMPKRELYEAACRRYGLSWKRCSLNCFYAVLLARCIQQIAIALEDKDTPIPVAPVLVQRPHHTPNEVTGLDYWRSVGWLKKRRPASIPGKRRCVRISDEELLSFVEERGEVTVRDAVDHFGTVYQTIVNRLRKLEEIGRVTRRLTRKKGSLLMHFSLSRDPKDKKKGGRP